MKLLLRDGSDMMRGGCSRDFRNRLFPSKLRLTYWKKTLRVELHPGNSKDANFEPCAVVEDLELAPGKYFGVSAATGGLADDHDVIQFTTFSLQDTEVLLFSSDPFHMSLHPNRSQMKSKRALKKKKKIIN